MAGLPVSLPEVVNVGVNAALEDVYVARPGRVTAYDPLTNTIVVKPMVKRAVYTRDGERSFEEIQEIPFVPVLFPRASGFAMTLPIEPGDYVLLVFNDVGLAEWRETGDVSESIDARRHSCGWPVAIPGFFPDVSPLSPAPLDLLARAAGLVLGEHGGNGRIEVTPTGIKLGKMAIDFVALATPTMANFVALTATVNALISGVGSLVTSLGTHTHSGVTTGAGASGPPVGSLSPTMPSAAAAPAAVAATMAKAL